MIYLVNSSFRLSGQSLVNPVGVQLRLNLAHEKCKENMKET